MSDEGITLEGVKWGKFLISDVAEIISGRDIDDDDKQPGNYPYISSSSVNNGISHFVSNVNDTLESDCISVCRTGSVGYAFYHPYEALYSNNCRKLRLYHRSKYAAMFIATQITGQRERYSYGYIMGTARLMRQKIMLPVDENGQPDYVFMERYIRRIEQKMIREYISFISAKIERIDRKALSLSCVKWGSFYLREIFSEIRRGKRLKTEDHITGNVPYVSSSAMNNGVDDFIGNTEGVRKFKDCMTIANSGSVGKTFFHEYEFIASDHVTALKSPVMNRYIYMFIAASAQRIGDKYSFNREINESRINREKIMLPVDESGQPDYVFMESFMRTHEQRLIHEYINHLLRKQTS